MSKLSDLEHSAILAIVGENEDQRIALEAQLKLATVTSRENTGGGFYTDIAVPDEVQKIVVSGTLGNEVRAEVAGLADSIYLILHFNDGRMETLEGYSYGVENTKTVDFETASFVIETEPPAK